MFAASTVLFLSLLSLTSGVIAKPLSYRREQALILRNAPPPPPGGPANESISPPPQAGGNDSISFNNWNNISSLQGFDDFNGQKNFDGKNNDQKIVIKEVETKCQVVKIELIQQKLVILQEMAKRIITEQICDVETQTIVLAQHNGALKVFSDDIQRKTVTRQVGFDEQVAQKITTIVKDDGSLSVDDAGFKGSDVGKNTVVPAGNNWSDDSSPAKVKAALDAAQSAINDSESDSASDSESDSS
ncbi:hypothetical protein DFH09DRAFT_285533 [Mycena vulgaris]|nr:hypothetical protein DFH09DRAFT_285533 [Mycena vulgaris]